MMQATPLYTDDQVREELVAAIAAAGSQAALAKAIGVSGAFISVIARGEKPPCGKVLDFLGIERVTMFRRKAQE